MLLATGCYTGYSPFAPGTIGTIAGIPLVYLLSYVNFWPAAIIVSAVIILSIRIAGRAEKILGKQDPGCIVIDEIAGLLVTLIGLPVNFRMVISGFIIFRILDIIKPFPIRYVDRNLHGGAGIVLDDIVAGIIGNIILRIGLHFIN